MNRLARRLGAGAAGPLAALTAAFATPVIAATLLDTSTYANWVLLATITTIATGMDLGASVAVTARVSAGDPGRTLHRKARNLTIIGTVATSTVGAVGYATVGTGPLIIMAATTVVSCARSVLQLWAAAGLALDGHTSTRTRALTTSAVVQITVTTGALLTGAGLWAAPVGLGAGTLAGWITIRPVRNHPQMTATGECAPLRSWVTSRFGVTGMTFWLTQADRFVITAVAGETAVAAYDIAWRTTAIPKLLASSLTQTLVADINTSSQPLALLRDTQKLIWATVTVTAIGCAAAGTVFADITGTHAPVWLILTLGTAQAAHAATACTTAAVCGLNRPDQEVPYLTVAAVTATVGYTAAAVTTSAVLAQIAAPVGLVIGTLWLTCTRPAAKLLTSLTTPGLEPVR